MYTLVHFFAVQPHQFENAQSILLDELLPVLRQQSGFVDYVLLESTTGPKRLTSISFWDKMESAHRYEREEYPKLQSMLVPFLADTAEVQEYVVNMSTFHEALDKE
jgi:quinol monooxygenase YgiN